MRAYIDSDILIWHLRGEENALKFLQKMRQSRGYELWIGSLQRGEVVFFMRPHEEQATLLFLSVFGTAAIDQEIVDYAGALYREWHPTHGTDVNDAFLAATVLKTGGKLYTLNTRHYPMEDLVVEKAW